MDESGFEDYKMRNLTWAQQTVRTVLHVMLSVSVGENNSYNRKCSTWSWKSNHSLMPCMIADGCRWEHCPVGEILSYAQQLARDYFLFLQIITANVLRDNNMVYKTCCKAVGVSFTSAHKPTLYKRTETTFTVRRFHSCHPNRLSGTICTPL